LILSDIILTLEGTVYSWLDWYCIYKHFFQVNICPRNFIIILLFCSISFSVACFSFGHSSQKTIMKSLIIKHLSLFFHVWSILSFKNFVQKNQLKTQRQNINFGIINLKLLQFSTIIFTYFIRYKQFTRLADEMLHNADKRAELWKAIPLLTVYRAEIGLIMANRWKMQLGNKKNKWEIWQMIGFLAWQQQMC
jgi:hypothetical protein